MKREQMNSRQAKKKRKFERLSNSMNIRFKVRPKGWSEIRWMIGWLKYPKGLENVSK